MRTQLVALILIFSGASDSASASPEHVNDFATRAVNWSRHPENAWVKQSPRQGAPAPKLVYEGSGAYDPHNRTWIHFGGHDGIPQGNHLFTYDLSTGDWEQKFPNTSPPGVCCVDGSNTFDVANGRFVAFPGASLGHGSQWSRSVRLKDSNVWLYDLESNTWTNMRPPPYKQPEKYSRDVIGGICSGATYDLRSGLCIAFGGTGAGGATNALFVYDAYANRFEQLRASNPPPNRDGMGLAYDWSRGSLVMFGSQYLDDERTWVYNFRTNQWQAYDLDPHPPAKKVGTYSTIPRMAYDPINDIMLCVVWLGEKGGHETWALDMSEMRWTKMRPATEPEPSKSRSRNLGFSPEYNVFILETVAVSGGPQIWTYRFKRPRSDGRLDPPRNLELKSDYGKVILTWSASVSSDLKAYHVYRALSDGGWTMDCTKIGATKDLTFEDDKTKNGQVYFYTVKAVGPSGEESPPSNRARSQPRVALKPVVSVLSADKVEVNWNPHPAADVAGYNIYRGKVSVATVRRGTPAAWKDNDPEYPEPVVVAVRDILDIQKLNDDLVPGTSFMDTRVDLSRKTPEAGDYRYAVYAYVVKAVNRLGAESGPSPYALTIPAEPQHLMLRERNGAAELRWDSSPEKGVVGYRVYGLGKSHWEIIRVTQEPIKATTFSLSPKKDRTRYWVVAIDRLGQEGQPSSPVWYNHSYKGFYKGDWHQ